MKGLWRPAAAHHQPAGPPMGHKPSKPPPPPLPEPPQDVIDADLLLGVMVLGALVAGVAVQNLMSHWWSSRCRSRNVIRCLGRSASCPVLDQLPKSAKEACATMMADFEDLKVRRCAPIDVRSPATPPRRRRSDTLASVIETMAVDEHQTALAKSRSESPSRSAEAAMAAARARQPHIIVLGDKQVGKSTVIDTLVKLANAKGVDLRVHEGLPEGCDEMDAFVTQASAVLVVWNAALADTGGTLREYVARHVQKYKAAYKSAAARRRMIRHRWWWHRWWRYVWQFVVDRWFTSPEEHAGRTLVLCNKTDQMLCPMPEIAGLQKDNLFLAGSARSGTNMSALFRRVEACAAPAKRWRRSLLGKL